MRLQVKEILMCLALSMRPEIIYTSQQASHFCNDHGASHRKFIQIIRRQLKITKDKDMMSSPYVNNSFEDCADTKISCEQYFDSSSPHIYMRSRAEYLIK